MASFQQVSNPIINCSYTRFGNTTNRSGARVDWQITPSGSGIVLNWQWAPAGPTAYLNTHVGSGEGLFNLGLNPQTVSTSPVSGTQLITNSGNPIFLNFIVENKDGGMVSMSSTLPWANSFQVYPLLYSHYTGLHAETIAWRNRCLDGGAAGSINSSSITIADNLIRELNNKSYSSKILWLAPMLGQNIAAGICALRHNLPKRDWNGYATNDGFVNSNFSESVGLSSDGTNRRIDINNTIAEVGTNYGFGFWETNYTAESPGMAFAAYSTDGNIIGGLQLTTTNQNFFARPGGTTAAGNYVGYASTMSNGHWYGNANGATLKLYKDGALVSSTGGALGSVTGTPQEITLMGAIPYFHYKNCRCACAYITDGTMTDAECTDFDTFLRTYLFTATGRPAS